MTTNKEKFLISGEERGKFFLPEEPFKGTLKGFLPSVLTHPALVESAKSRMFRLIVRQGVNVMRSEKLERIYGKPIVAYKAFDEFFGIEPYIHQVVSECFGAAIHGGEADKQVLVLIGPKGSGKSQFAKKLKKVLKTSEPIPYAAHSPMRVNPLNLFYLIPQMAQIMTINGSAKSARDGRAQILEQMGIREMLTQGALNFNQRDAAKAFRQAGADADFDGLISISDTDQLVSALVFGMGLPRATRANIGYPDPFVKDRVIGQYLDKKDTFNLWDYPIESFYFADDQEGSVGISSVKEVQPLNFDMRVMVGEENIAVLGNVDRADPRSVELNGAYNLSNRGMLEFVEGFKNPKEAHRSVLEATQDKSIPAPDPMRINLHWDGVLIYHSNAPEFRDFKNEPKNEPYLDRFIQINWPYPLEASEMERVIEKEWGATDFAVPKEEGGVHLEPTIIPYLSRFAVLTRLEPSTQVNDLMIKLEAYNGDESRLRGMGTKIDVMALKREATPWEGMDGVSPRFISKLLTGLASEAVAKHHAVTSREVRERLYESIRMIQDEKVQKLYREFISRQLDEWRRKRLARIVLAAMVPAFKDECQDLFKKYFDNVQAYNRNTTVRASSGSMYRSGPDEDFMRKIESDPELNITSAQSKSFRAEVASVVAAFMTDNQTVDVPYTCYEPLQRAIERFVCAKVKDTARILNSANAGTDEERRKLSTVRDRLVSEHGFDEHTADEVLKEAEETKDFLKEV